MKSLRLLALTTALLLGACGDEAPPMTQPDAGQMGLPLLDWVTELAGMTTDQAEPDTVDDKVIIDNEDPAAFDSFLQ